MGSTVTIPAIVANGRVETALYRRSADHSLVDTFTTAYYYIQNGATVDPATGTVSVDAGTASGTEFVVTADVESGRKQITADVFVYVQAEMPWRGVWREQAQYACGSGAEVAPEETLNEISFWADGTIWVTWLPFEVYVDYWGTHAFDTGAGTLAITATGGNYVPTDIDGTGTFHFDGANLILEDMWLGSPQGSTMPARCGHKLMR
jgi:hypothetical protein